MCAGAGLHFLADADVVIAADTATFTDTHVTVGQVAPLEPIMLAHRIGVGKALRFAVAGRSLPVSAAEALTMGLVDEVVAAAELQARALAVAEGIARDSPSAIRRSKIAIWQSVGRPLPQALQNGWELVREQWPHPDSKEGPRAFVAREEPQWEASPGEPFELLDEPTRDQTP